jgi:tRNA (guanine37-N1)-methyltransferase
VRIDVVTVFPDYLDPLQLSLLGKARRDGLLEVHVHDLRDATTDRHRTVDDTPYGGGPGMVMAPAPWAAALDPLLPPNAAGDVRLIVPTPSGERFTQQHAVDLAAADRLVFACGRYEGIDARVLDAAAERVPVLEVSLGDYVLAGGEAAVLVIVEAVARLLPGVLGNEDSVADDSFAPGAMAGLVEGPVYTKPAEWDGRAVPDVLRSGDHAAIARWRRDRAVERTARRRPDLIAGLERPDLDARDAQVLQTLGWQHAEGRWVPPAAPVGD